MMQSDDSNSNNDTENEFCNIDASVLALLERLPSEATVSQLHSRVAMIKLQQATIIGHSRFAAKLLENSLQEANKGKTAHRLLQARMEELQVRIALANRKSNETDATFLSSPSNDIFQSNNQDEVENADIVTTTDNEDRNAEIQTLQRALTKEKERGDAWQDFLMDDLTHQLASLQEDQVTLQKQQERFQIRLERVRKAIPQLPPEDPRTEKLTDQLARITHSQHDYQHPLASDAGYCVVCQDRPVALAVIPCGHLCLCEPCVELVESKPDVQKQCPVCRSMLLSTLKIYKSNK